MTLDQTVKWYLTNNAVSTDATCDTDATYDTDDKSDNDKDDNGNKAGGTGGGDNKDSHDQYKYECHLCDNGHSSHKEF